MAKVKFGAIVTDMRNKLGSSVFSRNRYGAYSRSFKVNVPSTTSAQEDAKTRFVAVSTAWKALTQEQRNAWNIAVADFQHTDIFGNTIRPSGFNLFVKLNTNRAFIGLSNLTDPPLPGYYTFPINPAITINTGDGVANLTFDNELTPGNAKWMLYCTAPISPGISYVKNRVRFIKAIDESVGSPVSFYTEYTDKFGVPDNGSRVSFALSCLIEASGQQSAPIYGTCIVTNVPTPPSNFCSVANFEVDGLPSAIYWEVILNAESNVDNLSIQSRQGSDPFVEFANVSPVTSYGDYNDLIAWPPGTYDFQVVATYFDSSTEVVASSPGVEVPS